MGAAEEARSGVLVLRAWVETAGDQGLRVRIIRITRTIQGDTDEPLTSASATVDDACAAVRTWLEELVHGPQHGWRRTSSEWRAVRE